MLNGKTVLGALCWKAGMAFVVMLLVISFSPQVSSGQTTNELFTDASLNADLYAQQEKEKQDPTIKRSRHVQIKPGLLDRQDIPFPGLPQPGAALPELPPSAAVQERPIVLNLFGDVSFLAIKDRMEMRSGSRYTWFGHVDGIKDSQVILVNEGGHLAGSVLVSEKHYQIRPTGGGDHAIYEVDESAYPPHADPIPVETEDTPSVTSPQASLSTNPTANITPFPTAACCDNGTVIDVMVVYTTAAAAASGNIASEIQLAIDSANAAYLNSGISQRLRLAHTGQVAYTESGDGGVDLGRLVNPSDGFMDQVHTLRDTYRADLVSLFVERLDSGGIALLMTSVTPAFAPYGFSIVRRSLVSPSRVLKKSYE